VRQKYSSQAAWDREQEIVHEAGDGELLFAEILNRHADKIIIRSSNFQVPPFWKRIGGFDHGKTNPTAARKGWTIAAEYVECISSRNERRASSFNFP